MMQILESGYIKPLAKTHQMNLCKCTTTMLDNAIYLSTEFMFASFYKPNTKQIIDGQEAYGCIIELELDYNKTDFLPDEDYMDDILSLDEEYMDNS